MQKKLSKRKNEISLPVKNVLSFFLSTLLGTISSLLVSIFFSYILSNSAEISNYAFVYLIFSFTKSRIRVFYVMPLILGLIIQNISFNNIYLKIISLVLLFILSVYTHFNEVGLTKKINNILCLLYLFNLFIIVEYSILFSFIFALSLFVFALLKHKERIKIVYLSLLVVPIFNMFDYTTTL